MSKSDTDFKKRMTEIGLVEADDTVYPRIICSVGGKEKSGKTNFSLTAPDPIAILSTDIGTEGVVNKFKAAGKDIWIYEIEMPEKYEEAVKIWDGDGSSSYPGIQKTYKKLIKIPEIRTIIFDTSTEMWELLRIRRFGRLEKVMPFQYGPVNAEFHRMLRQPYKGQKNLILLHKVKPVYINDVRTSDYENAGFGYTPNIVQVNLETFRTVPKRKCAYCDKEDGEHRHWCVKVKDCRQNPNLIDRVFIDRMCSFPILASLIIEGTDVEDWE